MKNATGKNSGRFVLAVFATATIAGAAASVGEAAIPNSRTIISRLARNSGRGAYVIEQEVRFSGGGSVATLKERWTVQNAEQMRLVVQGVKPGEYRWDALYRDGKRLGSPTQEPIGKESREPKNVNVPTEFMESLLFYRTPARYTEFFVRNRILPPAAAKERPRIGNLNSYKPSPEPAVRLSRTAGTIAWAFGEPTPVDKGVAYPGAWIEQDAFLLRKLRLPSQSEMISNEFAPAGAGLKLPRERTIIWRSHDASATEPRSATIKVLSVKAVPEKSLASVFQASSLSADAKAAKLPDDPVVHEFYQRFR